MKPFLLIISAANNSEPLLLTPVGSLKTHEWFQMGKKMQWLTVSTTEYNQEIPE